MKDLSLIATSTPFSFKTLFTKPLRYVIQLATGSKFEHVAVYCGGKVLQATGSGVELISFEEFKSHYEGSKIFAFEFVQEIKPKEVSFFRSFAKKHVGKEYSAWQAAYSAVDKIIAGEEIDEDNEFFCSELAAQLYKDLHWIKGVNPTELSPKDLAALLKKLGLVKKEQRCA